MILTATQRAQLCPTCVADPKAAPGRYCATCYCGHDDCPRAETYVARKFHIDIPYFTPPTLALDGALDPKGD